MEPILEKVLNPTTGSVQVINLSQGVGGACLAVAVWSSTF